MVFLTAKKFVMYQNLQPPDVLFHFPQGGGEREVRCMPIASPPFHPWDEIIFLHSLQAVSALLIGLM
jgi:hypothetical protein